MLIIHMLYATLARMMKVMMLPYLELNLSALMERCKLEELHRCSALFSHITEEQSHDIPSHRMRI